MTDTLAPPAPRRRLAALTLAAALMVALTPTVARAAGDTTKPGVAIAFPTKNQVLPVGPVSISGTASDDLSGVASAQIAIKDRIGGLWWDPTTSTWGTGLKWITTVLGTPGALSTPWSYSWTAGVAGGSYFVQARATDVAGNISVAFPSTQFTLTTGQSGEMGARQPSSGRSVVRGTPRCIPRGWRFSRPTAPSSSPTRGTTPSRSTHRTERPSCGAWASTAPAPGSSTIHVTSAWTRRGTSTSPTRRTHGSSS